MNNEKKKILVADDDPDLREQMVFYLKGLGYQVIACDSEKKATDALQKEKIDLAVLDLMMENNDSGFILAHRIKKQNKQTPVIIVTGVTKETGIHFEAKTPEERSWIKVDAFIQKDLRFEQLEGEIKKLLKD
ncbi:MAG: response regulator [Pseudomonadota bacterium]